MVHSQIKVYKNGFLNFLENLYSLLTVLPTECPILNKSEVLIYFLHVQILKSCPSINFIIQNVIKLSPLLRAVIIYRVSDSLSMIKSQYFKI